MSGCKYPPRRNGGPSKVATPAHANNEIEEQPAEELKQDNGRDAENLIQPISPCQLSYATRPSNTSMSIEASTHPRQPTRNPKESFINPALGYLKPPKNDFLKSFSTTAYATLPTVDFMLTKASTDPIGNLDGPFFGSSEHMTSCLTSPADYSTIIKDSPCKDFSSTTDQENEIEQIPYQSSNSPTNEVLYDSIDPYDEVDFFSQFEQYLVYETASGGVGD